MPISLQCDNLSVLPVGTLYERAQEWIRQNYDNEWLEYVFSLNKYFPTGPAPEESMKVDIIAVTESSTCSGLHLFTMFDSFLIHPSRHTRVRGNQWSALLFFTSWPTLVIWLPTERLSLIDSMRNFASPSEGIKSEERINSWANENTGVHIHRPTGNYGPPTTLF